MGPGDGVVTHIAHAHAVWREFGAKAVELVAEGKFGQMVAYTGTHVVGVPLIDAVGSLRTVPLDGGFIWTARSIGVCLGD